MVHPKAAVAKVEAFTPSAVANDDVPAPHAVATPVAVVKTKKLAFTPSTTTVVPSDELHLVTLAGQAVGV